MQEAIDIVTKKRESADNMFNNYVNIIVIMYFWCK